LLRRSVNEFVVDVNDMCCNLKRYSGAVAAGNNPASFEKMAAPWPGRTQ